MTDPSSVQYAATPKTRSALKLSYAEVSCPLDKHVIRRKRSELAHDPDGYIARGYSISISNDGANYGLSDSIVIFDSTCVNCTKDGDKIHCIKDVGLFAFALFYIKFSIVYDNGYRISNKSCQQWR